MRQPEFILIAFNRPPECRKGQGVSIMRFVTKSYGPDGNVEWERHASPSEVENEITKAGFVFTDWGIIEDKDIPNDRSFREAWVYVDGTISVSLPIAKECLIKQLRKDRYQKLLDLDVKFMQAIESGDLGKQKLISQEKKKLRDVTKHPLINQARSVKELTLISLSDLVK